MDLDLATADDDSWTTELVDLAHDLLLVLGFDGEFKRLNPAWERTLGFTRAELIGKQFIEFVHPEDRARTQREAALLKKGRTLVDLENRYRCKDGSYRWFAWTTVPKRERGVMFAVGRDITDRKRSEVELAQSAERLRSVLARAPVAVTTVDNEGRFTFAAGSVFTQIGIDPSTMVGLKVAERFADQPGLVEMWTRTVSQDVETDVKFGGRSFNLRYSPYRLTPDGEVLGVLMVAFDNTERVEANRALRQSEALFRALFEQSAVGISLYEVPRDGQPARVRWNNRMREMLGVDPDANGASSSLSAATGEGRPEAKEQYGRLISGESSQLRERRMLTRPDGSTVWADLSTVLVRDRDQRPLRLQTMALDISDQVEAEQRLSRRAIQQGVLLELAQAGLEPNHTVDFLAKAVVLVERGSDTQLGTILELRPSDGSIVRVAAPSHADGIPSDAAPVGSASRVLEALNSEMPVLALDYHETPEFERSQWMIDAGIVASMAVGIRGPISPFGILSVHSTDARIFSTDDRQFMLLASTIISVAVERKREERQRRLLLGRLVTAQEAERKSIAKDIHDDAVQVMTAANLRVELLRMGLTDPVQVDAAEKLQENVSLATGRLRNLLFELSPPDLERHGLVAGLTRHLEQFEADAAVSWQLEADLGEEPSQQVRIVLFRIFQEALANVRKHARATHLTVTLTTADGGVLMRVSDNGAGCDNSRREPVGGHLGLAAMRERAELAGGWWRLNSEVGNGTEVATWLPAPHR